MPEDLLDSIIEFEEEEPTRAQLCLSLSDPHNPHLHSLKKFRQTRNVELVDIDFIGGDVMYFFYYTEHDYTLGLNIKAVKNFLKNGKYEKEVLENAIEDS